MSKLIPFLLLLMILPLSCGGGDSSETEITWWQFWTSPEVKPTITELAKGFEGQNPSVSIAVGELTWSDGHEKIAISLASGEGPDVIELGSDWVAEFAAEGRLLNLTDKIGDLVDRLQMWGPASYEGQIYAVPWMLGTRALFCNRSLLTAAGYGTDFVPQSWEELLEAATKVNNLGKGTFGFGSNSAERHRLYKKFLPFFWTAGGRVFSEDGRSTMFDTPEGRKSLEYYLALSETGLIESQARLEEYFAAGQIAFVISGEWFVRRLRENNSGLDYSVTTMPGIERDEIGASFAGGEYLVINADSEQAEAAMAFIKHLTSRANDRKFAYAVGSFTPVNRGNFLEVSAELEEVARVFQQQLVHAQSTPVHPRWVQVEEIIESGVEQALYGKMTAAAALRFIDGECAKVLARNAVTGNEQR